MLQRLRTIYVLLPLLAILVALAGACQSASLTVAGGEDGRAPPPCTPPDKVVRLPAQFFLMGLYPREIILTPPAECNLKRALTIKTYASLRDLAFEQATFGVYSPRTIEIRCCT